MTAHQAAASARGEIWRLLSELMSYPTPGLIEKWESGRLDRQLDGWVKVLPYDFKAPVFLDDHQVNRGSLLQSEFLRVFELPVDGKAPCPLYGGVLVGNRQRVMEELLRLYRHFGLSTQGSEMSDLPDSFCTVMEFLYFLTSHEGQASEGDVESVRRAQRDVLEKHLGPWVVALESRMEERSPPAFYKRVVELLNHFLRAEAASLS